MISRPDILATRRWPVVVGVIALIGLGFVTLKLWPAPAESAALADVIREAQTAELNLDTVPAGYQGPGSPATVMQPVLDHVQTELAKYYVGTLLARKVEQYQAGIRAIAVAGGGARVGGVRALDLKDIQVLSLIHI